MTQWIDITPPDLVDRCPPPNTKAIVVDVRERRGAVKIYEANDDSYLGGVGNESAAFVVVPWNKKWNFSCFGFLRVANIVEKNS
jgi:hypothetical protein